MLTPGLPTLSVIPTPSLPRGRNLMRYRLHYVSSLTAHQTLHFVQGDNHQITENWSFQNPHPVIPNTPPCHSDPRACRPLLSFRTERSGERNLMRCHPLHSPPRRSARFLVANSAPRNDKTVSFLAACPVTLTSRLADPSVIPTPRLADPSVIPTPRLAEGEESNAPTSTEFTTPMQYQIPRRKRRSSE
jgi:hypothetical protein